MSEWVAGIPSPGPEWQKIPIDIFGLHWRIQTYAIIILIAIIISAAWTNHRLNKRGAEPGVVLDIVLWAVPLGIIGARFYHVFTHPENYFYSGANLWNVFAIWDGGNAIFGALIGGGVGVWIACRWTGLRFTSFADALAPALLLAQGIGRLGNYFNQELFGLPTNLPWGLEISPGNSAIPVGLPADTLFHPLFLYEMVWDIGGAIFLAWLGRRLTLQWGRLFALYLVWYGAGRAYLESIRIDPSEFNFLGIESNTWAAFAAIVLGVIIFLVQSRRHTGLEPSPYRPGREWSRSRREVELYEEEDDDVRASRA